MFARSAMINSIPLCHCIQRLPSVDSRQGRASQHVYLNIRSEGFKRRKIRLLLCTYLEPRPSEIRRGHAKAALIRDSYFILSIVDHNSLCRRVHPLLVQTYFWSNPKGLAARSF